MSSRGRGRAVAIAVALASIAVVVRHVTRLHVGALAGTALLAATWLAARMIFAAGNRPFEVEPSEESELRQLRVVAAIPFYNEDAAWFSRCLAALAAQTRPIDAIWLVDDYSTSDACLRIAHQFAAEHPERNVHVVRLEQNLGKRHAQAAAFRGDRADVWLTCDSDTELAPDAVSEGLKPFALSDVHAVAGLTLGKNWRKNILTRILDIEFANSFLIGRASMSRFGSVLVACGTIALYRDVVVSGHLDDYLNESFLGHEVRAGDDRRLTQYALLHGRVVFQESAVGYTALPERMSHLVRQRIRWSASFYRGAVWVAQNLSMKRAAYWFVVAQVIELVLVAFMLGAFFVHAANVGLRALFIYMVYMTVLSYIRSLRYLALERADMTTADRLTSVALAPLIALLYTLILNPVRYWSITKVTDARWGTRRKVEIVTPDVPALTEAPTRDAAQRAGA